MSSTFLFEELPIDAVGAEHSRISLLSILQSALGPDLGGYTGFWIADAGSDWLATEDFNYWNPAAPDPSTLLSTGQVSRSPRHGVSTRPTLQRLN